MFNHIKNTIFIILGSAILAIFTYTAIAFTEPSLAPPGGNVPPPINIGSTAQTKSGPLTLGSLTVSGAGTFAQLCMGGSCRSLWSDIFNPSGSYPSLTVGTANTLQGYTVGSGANQIPVTDSSGRLSSSVMPAGFISGACSYIVSAKGNCPAGTYQHSYNSFNEEVAKFMIVPQMGIYHYGNLNEPVYLDQCNFIKTCRDRGGNLRQVRYYWSDPYGGVGAYYDPRNNCILVPPPQPLRWHTTYYAEFACYIPLRLCCPE